MGWQSYMVFYKSVEERKHILYMIYKHNNEENFDIIGEPLHSLCSAIPIKRLRDKGVIGVILCGHGGGRHQTMRYFDRAFKGVIKFEFYMQHTAKLICKKNQVSIENWEKELESILI